MHLCTEQARDQRQLIPSGVRGLKDSLSERAAFDDIPPHAADCHCNCHGPHFWTLLMTLLNHEHRSQRHGNRFYKYLTKQDICPPGRAPHTPFFRVSCRPRVGFMGSSCASSTSLPTNVPNGALRLLYIRSTVKYFTLAHRRTQRCFDCG